MNAKEYKWLSEAISKAKHDVEEHPMTLDKFIKALDKIKDVLEKLVEG